MNYTTVEPGEHATFTTIRKDKPIQFAVSLEDHIALGEMLGASMERVAMLEADALEAANLIFKLRSELADAQQSLAIERRNVQRVTDQLRDARDETVGLQAVRDQLRDARDENAGLHAALRKSRTDASLHDARLTAMLDVLNAVAGIISSARIMGGVSVMGTQDALIGKRPYEELERAFLAYANAAQQEAQQP